MVLNRLRSSGTKKSITLFIMPVSVVTLDEPYVKEPATRSYVSGIIPPDEYFVLGDNRNNTNDSRNGWMVPTEDIIGKAWLSIWPPDKWGLAANYPPLEQIASAASD